MTPNGDDPDLSVSDAVDWDAPERRANLFTVRPGTAADAIHKSAEAVNIPIPGTYGALTRRETPWNWRASFARLTVSSGTLLEFLEREKAIRDKEEAEAIK